MKYPLEPVVMATQPEDDKSPPVGDDYSLSSIGENRHLRELRRIKTSPSFRLGVVIVRALEFPPRLLWLPFSLLAVGVDIVREKLGKKGYEKSNYTSLNPENHRRSVVFFPTNGVGFGHFTRLFAIARRMRRLDPDIELVFFTTMSTVHLLYQNKIVAYHIPGRKKYRNMKSAQWNALTEELLSTVIQIHNPVMFIFDGAYPYRGVLNTIKEHETIHNIWLRRGTFRKGGSTIPKDSIEHFDLILRPGDSTPATKNEVSFSTPIKTYEPIIFLDADELGEKATLRQRIGVPLDATLVYIQLGAGNINDIHRPMEDAIKALLKHHNTYILVGESLIGDRMEFSNPHLRIIRDYPNSYYFPGIDFCIIAGGYNSYHEVVHFNLPSICIPNLNTGMDDQRARAIPAEEAGGMVIVSQGDYAGLEAAIKRMMNPLKRRRMSNALLELGNENGAEKVAQDLLKMVDELLDN